MWSAFFVVRLHDFAGLAKNQRYRGQPFRQDWGYIVKNMANAFAIVSKTENMCCGFVGLRGSGRPVILTSRFIAVQ
jgi:hypothetical protein